MTCSATASGSASSPSSLHNYKSNLLTDKIILLNADNEKEEENDIIIVAQAAPEPLTLQASQGQSKCQ